MYDSEYYAAMDRIMGNTLKGTALTVGSTIMAIVYYLLMQPLRLYDYICDGIKTEKQSQREEEKRFRILKRSGHI